MLLPIHKPWNVYNWTKVFPSTNSIRCFLEQQKVEKHECKTELFASSSLVSEAKQPGKGSSELAKSGDHREERQDHSPSHQLHGRTALESVQEKAEIWVVML